MLNANYAILEWSRHSQDLNSSKLALGIHNPCTLKDERIMWKNTCRIVCQPSLLLLEMPRSYACSDLSHKILQKGINYYFCKHTFTAIQRHWFKWHIHRYPFYSTWYIRERKNAHMNSMKLDIPLHFISWKKLIFWY